MSLISEMVALRFRSGECFECAGQELDRKRNHRGSSSMFLSALLTMLRADPDWVFKGSHGTIHSPHDDDPWNRRECLQFRTRGCDHYAREKFVELLESKYTDEDVVLAIENLMAEKIGLEKKLAEASWNLGILAKAMSDLSQSALDKAKAAKPPEPKAKS